MSVAELTNNKVIFHLVVAIKNKITYSWAIKKEKVEIDSTYYALYSIEDYLSNYCGYDVYEDFTILEAVRLDVWSEVLKK